MIIVTPHQALAKAYKYCAYQERSQFEVRDKLFSFGLENDEIENIIFTLIEENFLNEERFALAYSSGKFRISKWGKIKIKQGLKEKNVSDYCIKKALSSIDNTEYAALIIKLIKQKSKLLTDTNKLSKSKKVINFLLSKGFEYEAVLQEVKLFLQLK